MPRTDSGDRETGQGTERRRFFEREVERLMDRLYGAALRLTRDPHDAEDVVAEAVGRAWARLDELRDPERFEGWIFRILNNTFVSMWRRRQSRRTVQSDLERMAPGDEEIASFSLFQKLHQPFLLWWGTPQDQFLDNVLQDDLQKAVDALPDEFRIVVVLVEVQGYTYEETANLLDIPLGTVRSRLSRGRALLQKALWDQAREMGLVGRPRTKPGGEGEARDD